MKEEVIRTYMNTHDSRDNVVFTWLLWNFEKLDKLWNTERIYFNHNVFDSVVKEAYGDKFVVLITDNGKFRATETNIVTQQH